MIINQIQNLKIIQKIKRFIFYPVNISVVNFQLNQIIKKIKINRN